MKILREDVLAAIRDADVVEDLSTLRDDVPLREQGIDSLGMFNILLLIDEKLGVQTPDEDIDRLHTIEQLVAYYADR